MRALRPSRYLPNHPLAAKNGKVIVSRLVLFEKLGGSDPQCHWCGADLTWRIVCADHLDSDPANNAPGNVVPSCRGCNANRDDGTGHGRRPPQTPCERCGAPIRQPLNRRRRRFCSIGCANLARGPRGSKHDHGTRGRYKYGCRCPDCTAAQAAYAHELWLLSHPIKSSNKVS